MPAKIIDGNKIAESILEEIKSKMNSIKAKPGIAIVLVGNNPASEVYVNFKEKDSKRVGFHCERYNLPENTPETDVLALINKLNNSKAIHGILAQLPLPAHIDEDLITNSILPQKDVDGFTPLSLGNLLCEKPILAPATARACIHLIETTGTEIKGKNAVVIGRSKIVGKPVAMMLLEKNATVTICHSKTKNISEFTRNADILIVAAGKPSLVTKDMVKPGAVVIDVGINRVGKELVGDVDFDSVKEVAGFITPVPGGVGPMTRAMLMQNTLKAMEMQEKD
jgi:methylenetetrahydrofolate dehydrogenase (NADP+) / methenyltetrahydrofolate cyclohydrolase